MSAKDKDDKQLEPILERIREARSFDFRDYKRATLRRRIERRMTDRRCKSYRDYLALLEREPQEFDALVSAMLIKVTGFFRDEETWNQLQKTVIPGILSRKRPGEDIRVWCAGCATGEEAFSIAILFAEALSSSFSTSGLKVFGTDVDEAAIAAARRAIYTRRQVENVNKERLSKWFQGISEGYLVRKEVRRMVVFGVNNLVSDAPISRLDLLLCRNVFIYLDTNLQRRVLSRFHYALVREGSLVLGKSELIPFAAKVFEPVDLAHRVYRRHGRADLPTATQERLAGLLEQKNISHDVDESRDELAALGQYSRDLVASLGVPVITTTLDGTVVLWNRAATKLWKRGENEVLGKKLTALALPGLTGDTVIEKTALLREASSTRETFEAQMGYPGEPNGVSLLVSIDAVRDLGEEIIGLVYTVQDTSKNKALETELHRVTGERQSALTDLQSSNQELQSSNEELETTNEELQSANEELQTTNEELQSTNEELETTNEELQSTNAELDATNRELAHRTEELNLLSFYQRTIIRSLSSAVAVLDPHGRINMWNLAAERLLGLRESEAEGQLFWTLHVPAFSRSLLTKMRRSLSQNQSYRVEAVDYELPNGSTGVAQVTAVPLLEGGNNLGSVILFEDITPKRNAAALQARVEKDDKVKKLRPDGE